MEFTRRKVKGRHKSEYKRWLSECGCYKIEWVNQYTYKHYHATVKCLWKGEEKWHFALRMGPYKTFKKAVEACEKNRKLWDAFIQLSHSPGRRDTKFPDLKARAPMVFWFIPKWVWPEADQHFIRMVYPCAGSLNDRSLDTETSETTSTSEPDTKPRKKRGKTQTTGPALSAAAEEKSDTKKTETSSKATSSPPGTDAPTATEPAAGSKPKSKRSGTKSRKPSAKNSKRGKSKTSSAEAG